MKATGRTSTHGATYRYPYFSRMRAGLYERRYSDGKPRLHRTPKAAGITIPPVKVAQQSFVDSDAWLQATQYQRPRP